MTLWLKVLLVLVISIGIILRLVNLDHKVYWYDETFTSLQLSGYSAEEIKTEILDGSTIQVKDLYKYQYPSPNSHKTVVDTIQRIAIVEPQLTPLYFILARSWVQIFGESITAIRSLSAVFSILSLPLLYWLCQELFQTKTVSLLAVALFACSPFQLLYAQEARPYSMWTCSVIFSCACMLTAMRVQKLKYYLLYGISIILGLYTFLFSLLVNLVQGIYVLIVERFKFSSNLRIYLLTNFVGLVSFIPWLYVVIVGKEQAMGTNDESFFRNQRISLPSYIVKFVKGLVQFFADFNINEDSNIIQQVLFGILTLLLLALTVYAIYFLWINADKKSSLFLLLMISVPVLLLMIPDLVSGGQRAITTRYVIPSFLAAQIVVAYLLGIKINTVFLASWQQQWWRICTVLVMGISIWSCVYMSQSYVWWNKADYNVNYDIAKVINQSGNTLVVSDVWVVNILSLSHLLKPQIDLRLTVAPDVPTIPPGYKDVFIYEPSELLQKQLEDKYKLTLIIPGKLWRIN